MTASPRAANGGLLRSTLGSLWPGNYPGEIALINTLINNAAIIRWPETPGDNCLHRNGLGHLDNHLPPAAVSTESLSEVLCGPARSDPGEARAQAGPIHGRGGGQRAAESQETSSREEPRPRLPAVCSATPQQQPLAPRNEAESPRCSVLSKAKPGSCTQKAPQSGFPRCRLMSFCR